MHLSEAVVVPVIMSIVELAKGLGMPKKFSAITAVAIGILAGIFFMEHSDIKMGIFKGVVYGLTASGLYSGTKNTYQQMKPKKAKSTKSK